MRERVPRGGEVANPHGTVHSAESPASIAEREIVSKSGQDVSQAWVLQAFSTADDMELDRSLRSGNIHSQKLFDIAPTRGAPHQD